MSNEAINWAFATDVSRSTDKLVLLVLANAANEHWACFPGKEEIATKASCAPSSIVHCTRRLEAAGHLARIPFKALAGQDQKIGYVLAGGGRINGLDEEFLALAFAARKLPGRPLPDKPKHWSGQRRDDAVSIEFEQGDQLVTLAGQGDYLVTPRGDQLVTPRTLSRTPTTTKDSDAATAASISLDAIASSMPCDDAHASSAAAMAAARDESATESRTTKAKPRRVSLDKRLDEHLAALGPAVVDALLQELDDGSRDGIIDWSAKRARKELGLDWSADPRDDSGGKYARLVVGKALMKLTKPNGGGTSAEADDLLGAFDWPVDRRPSPGKKPRKDRPRLPWIVYYHRPAEADDPKAHDALYGRVTALSDAALAAKVTEFRTYRPGLWKDSDQSAREQFEAQGARADASQVTRLAYQYAIKHAIDNYKGSWPMFVIPEAPCVLGAELAAAA